MYSRCILYKLTPIKFEKCRSSNTNINCDRFKKLQAQNTYIYVFCVKNQVYDSI